MEFKLETRHDFMLGSFAAMASSCEILVDTTDPLLAHRLTEIAHREARRIEQKFSRYRDDNIIYQINSAGGKTITVDDETALLLDFAGQCYSLSNGMFDITSGVLRKIWTFDGSDNIPTKKQVDKIRNLVGWEKITWEKPNISLPAGMQIDLGGIGKEYAVDRVFNLISQETKTSFLVNFGGDLRTNHPRKSGKPWTIGIEDPDHPDSAASSLQIKQGALATSGDSKRYLLKNGIRYSHVLNPKTGWPVKHAPRSVTVAGPTATDAGILATFAQLQGKKAKRFLKNEGAKFWLLE